MISSLMVPAATVALERPRGTRAGATRARRELWRQLPAMWQGWLAPGTAAPDDARLAAALAATTLTIGERPARHRGAISLAPLARLPALATLIVVDGLPLATLPRLPRLTTLHVDRSPLPDDLGARLPRLQELELRYAGAVDLAPVARLRGLRRLDLACSRVHDLAPLARLDRLERLSLFACERVADLAPLRRLVRLRELELTGTAVADLGPLASLTGLRTLGLGDTRVDDLTPLLACPRLTSLDAHGSAVTDVAAAARLATLEALDLRATDVVDVRPLRALGRLRALNLDETLVPSPLADALAATLRARHRDADLRYPHQLVAHFPGALDAAMYGLVADLFAQHRILEGSGALYIAEACVARPGDWHYAVQRMAFDRTTSVLTLWLDLYGSAVALELWAPRDVRVGPDQLTIGGAARIVFGGKRYPANRRTAFRLG